MNLFKCTDCYFGNRDSAVLFALFFLLVCTAPNEVQNLEFSRFFFKSLLSRQSILLE